VVIGVSSRRWAGQTWLLSRGKQRQPALVFVRPRRRGPGPRHRRRPRPQLPRAPDGCCCVGGRSASTSDRAGRCRRERRDGRLSPREPPAARKCGVWTSAALMQQTLEHMFDSLQGAERACRRADRSGLQTRSPAHCRGHDAEHMRWVRTRDGAVRAAGERLVAVPRARLLDLQEECLRLAEPTKSGSAIGLPACLRGPQHLGRRAARRGCLADGGVAACG